MDAHRYPRPQLERTAWTNLNGRWSFAIDAEASYKSATEVDWNASIVVPFSPETPSSDVCDSGFFKACWYRRQLDTPKLSNGERAVLHFGAVDWHASVWVNGHLAVEHEGGYTPFSVDITQLLVAGDKQEIVVRSEDDPQDFAKPRGKQDWELNSHSIWYPRTSGIWQTVWMEVVPAYAISRLKWASNVPDWRLELVVDVDGNAKKPLWLAVKLKLKDEVLAEDRYRVTGGRVKRHIELPDPGIDAARDDLLWSPERPTLISAEVQLVDDAGNVIDSVSSYTAMRSVDVDHNKFLLNGRPYDLRMVLDQGYWPRSGMTAPDDAALRQDVELIKLMKFNGVRMHQKIEDPRFLYWADYLGLLVWEEMPSAYRFDERAVHRLTATWTEAIERDSSHPCIVAWVPFNESWGLPDLPKSKPQRDYLRSIYYLTKTLDPTRPVIGNDGWEMVATDIIAIHDYGQPAELTARFHRAHDQLHHVFAVERPGGRVLLLDGMKHDDKPLMLTEFGGICYSTADSDWGYRKAESAEDFELKYAELMRVVRATPLLSGYCYTQFTDTYQEANGLLDMNRKPKMPLQAIANSNGDAALHFLEVSQPEKRRG